ncbi:MAG: TMEM14 family protein [Phycisphaeraceae bacterium]|nr:TMEM14 family protein [Phycisphaeraceae bacterium]
MSSIISMVVYVMYVVLLLVGGVMGFKAGSRISLIMGSVSACLMIVSLLAMKMSTLGGHMAIAILSLALAVVFVIRFVKTGSFMPGGLMLIASAIVLGVAIREYLRVKSLGS